MGIECGDVGTLTPGSRWKRCPEKALSFPLDRSVAGTVPRWLRASLSSFSQLTPVGPVFSQCTGCSPRVLSQLRSQGWDMVRQVMESPKYLEDLTGLTDLMSDADLMAAVIDISDDDTFSVSSGDV